MQRNKDFHELGRGLLRMGTTVTFQTQELFPTTTDVYKVQILPPPPKKKIWLQKSHLKEKVIPIVEWFSQGPLYCSLFKTKLALLERSALFPHSFYDTEVVGGGGGFWSWDQVCSQWA